VFPYCKIITKFMGWELPKRNQIIYIFPLIEEKWM
jgi:hypothetical protein